MRLTTSTPLIALLLLGTASAATSSSANQPCGTDKECEANCEKGTYHIATSETSVYFACSFDGVAKYSIGECLTPQGSDKGPKNTKATCESVGGEISRGACVFVQDDASAKGYSDACVADNGNSHVEKDYSYERVRRFVGW